MQFLIKFSFVFCCVFLLSCQGKNGSASQSGDASLQSASSSAGSSVSNTTSSESVINSSDSENMVLQSIFNRKSVRDYSDKEISQDMINNLLKAGMSAPSSRDRRPWHFIVISDKTVLESLGDQLKNASCLKGANKAIVVCGDDELSDNCWFLDCSAAAQNILIAAESMGLGAVWTAVYPYDDRTEIVNKTFDLKKNIHALTIIPLGYPAEDGMPKDKFDETRVHYNKW